MCDPVTGWRCEARAVVMPVDMVVPGVMPATTSASLPWHSILAAIGSNWHESFAFAEAACYPQASSLVSLLAFGEVMDDGNQSDTPQ